MLGLFQYIEVLKEGGVLIAAESGLQGLGLLVFVGVKHNCSL